MWLANLFTRVKFALKSSKQVMPDLLITCGLCASVNVEIASPECRWQFALVDEVKYGQPDSGC